MKLIIGLAKLAFALAVLTAVGQVRIRGESLEWKYHRLVNSSRFQKTFWVAALPITYTSAKINELIAETRTPRNENRPAAR